MSEHAELKISINDAKNRLPASDYYRLPSPFTKFSVGGAEFEADEFELWEGLTKIYAEVKDKAEKEGKSDMLAFPRAVVQWIDDTYAVAPHRQTGALARGEHRQDLRRLRQHLAHR